MFYREALSACYLVAASKLTGIRSRDISIDELTEVYGERDKNRRAMLHGHA